MRGARIVLVGALLVATALAVRPRAPVDAPVVATIATCDGEVLATYDSDGSLRRWNEYVRTSDGELVRHGVALWFHAEGTVFVEQRFVAGRKSGSERVYDREGRIMAEREYARGKPVGLARNFDLDGLALAVRRFERGIVACTPLLRERSDPPLSDDQIACLVTEPTYWQ